MPVHRHQVPLDTAKSWAKRLTHSSKTLSPAAPWKLSQSQKAIAHILGFDDWHALETALGTVFTPSETPSNPYHQVIPNPDNISNWTLFWEDLLQQDGVDGVMLEQRVKDSTERGITVKIKIARRDIEHLYLDITKPHTLLALEALWPTSTAESLVAGGLLQEVMGSLKINNPQGSPHTYISMPVYGQKFGLDIHLRPTATPNNVSLYRMGFSGDLVRALREISQRPKGLFVFTGTYGSGKETLMRACMGVAYDTHRDPPEYLIPRVSAIPVIRQDDPHQPNLWGVSIENPGRGNFRIYTISDRQSPIDADFAVQINTKHGGEEEITRALHVAMRGGPDLLVLNELKNQAGAKAITQCLKSNIAAWTTFNSNGTPRGAVERLEDFLPDVQWVQPDWLEGGVACSMISTLCPQCAVSAGNGSERLEGPGCTRCRGVGHVSKQMVVDLWKIVEGKPVELFCRFDQAQDLITRGVVSKAAAEQALGRLDRSMYYT